MEYSTHLTRRARSSSLFVDVLLSANSAVRAVTVPATWFTARPKPTFEWRHCFVRAHCMYEPAVIAATERGQSIEQACKIIIGQKYNLVYCFYTYPVCILYVDDSIVFIFVHSIERACKRIIIGQKFNLVYCFYTYTYVYYMLTIQSFFFILTALILLLCTLITK